MGQKNIYPMLLSHLTIMLEIIRALQQSITPTTPLKDKEVSF